MTCDKIVGSPKFYASLWCLSRLFILVMLLVETPSPMIRLVLAFLHLIRVAFSLDFSLPTEGLHSIFEFIDGPAFLVALFPKVLSISLQMFYVSKLYSGFQIVDSNRSLVLFTGRSFRENCILFSLLQEVLVEAPLSVDSSPREQLAYSSQLYGKPSKKLLHT